MERHLHEAGFDIAERLAAAIARVDGRGASTSAQRGEDGEVQPDDRPRARPKRKPARKRKRGRAR